MNKQAISFISVSVMLIIVTIYAGMTGSLQVSLTEFVQGIFGEPSDQMAIVRDLRFPRMLIAIFAGACLSVSGVLFQAVMRNPLAEPGIIGVSAGASFVSIIAAMLFPTLFFYTPLFSFIGGMIAFFLVYILSWKSGIQPLRMILIGIAINALFSGLSQMLGATNNALVTSISSSVTSSLQMKKWSDVESIVIFGSIGLLLAFIVFKWCNYLQLEQKTAKSLGLNVNLLRWTVSIIAVLLASIATAVAGMFTFVGLLIPHIGRSLVGSDHRVLIPFSALAGALLILLADTIGRTVIAPHEIPASVMMAVIGGPFLILLLRRSEQIDEH
ncbi:FecCD family ABC transporter permease [Paenibacillus yanchengensis]|uniref:Probable heme-iron transport system permease protein IsdF n=1 Tax=Paenibacillus yanchengensis TaxID=2035833 RepID=A0ABW4YQ57_9BACL